MKNFQIIRRVEENFNFHLTKQTKIALFTIIRRYERGEQIHAENGAAYACFQVYLKLKSEKGFVVL